MTLSYTKNEKLDLKRHSDFNEQWLHDRIADDPSILGFGGVRILDRERSLQGGGRLDILLLDDDNNRRYEVEVQLGATDSSHIIRCIEYWDLERRRYPGYDHVAVLIAENVTTGFLNVMSLLAGSIPLIAIQLDALSIEDRLLLNFVQVLDQTDLRIDDTDDSGGGATDRGHWNKKAGITLMKLCDEILALINSLAAAEQKMNYLQRTIGLQSNGVVNNFIFMKPTPTRNYVHIFARITDAKGWSARLEEAGLAVTSKRSGRLRLSISAEEYDAHKSIVSELIQAAVAEFEG